VGKVEDGVSLNGKARQKEAGRGSGPPTPARTSS